MHISETKLKGVLSIKLDNFIDHRGKYVETYNEDEYFKQNITTKFVQDDISISKKNVLRGIHGDEQTTKLVSCLSGSFYLVVVNKQIVLNNFNVVVKVLSLITTFFYGYC